MKKTMSILLALAILVSCAAALAETNPKIPGFMIPAKFVSQYNSLLETMVKNMEADNAKLMERYSLTQKDVQNSIVYFGTDDWSIEASFYYANAGESADTNPSQAVNLAIRNDAPPLAFYTARRIFAMMILLEYPDAITMEEIDTWLEADIDSRNMLSFPGYSLAAFAQGDYTQYAFMPAETDALEGVAEPDAIEGVAEPDAIEGVAEPDAIEGVAEPDAIEGAAEPDRADQADRQRDRPDESALLTVSLDGYDYTLGKSTPADMAKDGWTLNTEEDGTITVTDKYHEGMFFVRTEHGAPDEPVTMINAMWADDIAFEYCGFDGIINPGLPQGEDPDERWNHYYPYEVLVNAWENPDIVFPRWGAMQNWLTDTYGGTLNEEGFCEEWIRMSDGRMLIINTNVSPVRLELVSK